MKIKKKIELVNNERLKTTVRSGKSCDANSTDHCYTLDNAKCTSYSIDICATKDAAGCYSSSEDVCFFEEDTIACNNGQHDYT